MTTTPAKKAPAKTIKMLWVERELPDGEMLEINDFEGRPEVQVLDVHRREGPMQQHEDGHFVPTWINTWKLVLVWR